jgi:hypothetical protein
VDYVARTDNSKLNSLHGIIFSDGGWAPLNFKLAKVIGFEESGVYSILLNMYINYYNRKELTDDGFFFCTVPYFEKRYGLKRRRQDNIFKKLEEAGLITITHRSKEHISSMRRYIKINLNSSWLRSMLEDKEEAPLEEEQE